MILRDAADQSPHQRHEKLVAVAAGSAQEGERLMWFFQRGFAFRLSERFQTMNEFTSELMRFADVSGESPLDLIEQFQILSHNVESNDRSVQLVALRKKYSEILQPIQSALSAKLSPINKHQGSLGIGSVRLTKPQKAQLPTGDPFESDAVTSYTVSRNHFNGAAVALLRGFAQGMDIHLYTASYTHPLAKDTAVEWSKVAVIGGNEQKISQRTLAVVVDNLANKLAHEIRNLILKREQVRIGSHEQPKN